MLKGKNLKTKGIIPGKVIIQIWKREKEFPRQGKAWWKGAHHCEIGLIRNVKGTSFNEKGKTITRNKKIMKEKNLTGIKAKM